MAREKGERLHQFRLWLQLTRECSRQLCPCHGSGKDGPEKEIDVQEEREDQNDAPNMNNRIYVFSSFTTELSMEV
jgi:hypothetical protein